MTSNQGSSGQCFGLPSKVVLPKPPDVGNGKTRTLFGVKDDIGNELEQQQKNVKKKKVLNTDVMILMVDSDCYIYYLIV